MRERPDEILPLALHFLQMVVPEGQAPPMLSPGAAQTLLSHNWPGNVRELRNVIERSVILARNVEVLSQAHIRF